MTRQLGGDEAGRGRVPRQVVQHAAERLGAFAVGLAEDDLAARLVPGGVERPGAGLQPVLADAPAAQHGSEGRDVGLGVDAGPRRLGAERVQLEHLAGQVLVDAGDARAFVLPGGAPRLESNDARVRPGRLGVVEVAQHRRVRGRGEQQGLEVAGNVRADGIALESADEAARGALELRDREVVGPEPVQPLGERPLRRGGGRQARERVGEDHVAVVAGKHLLGGHSRWRLSGELPLLALGGDVVECHAGVEQAAATRHVGRPDPRRQPAARVEVLI